MSGLRSEHIKEAAAVVSQYCDIVAIRAFASLSDKNKDEEGLFTKIKTGMFTGSSGRICETPTSTSSKKTTSIKTPNLTLIRTFGLPLNLDLSLDASLTQIIFLFYLFH